jgi:hypothetical protein
VLRLPCVTIDDILDEENIPFLDVLHADIQGAELDMLRGCQRSLAGKRIGFLFISTHPGKHDACLAHLRQLDYRIIFEHSIEESCSGDGLIVASGGKAPSIPAVPVTKTVRAGRVRESLGGLMELLTRRENRQLWSAIGSSEP